MIVRIPPLLHKELVELAAARRTYVLRAVVAVGFLLLFLLVAAPELRRLAAGDVSVIGSGGHLFRLVGGWAFLAIYLFLPLTMVPAVALDEERGNLELLRVAGLQSPDYLAQKLVSRLIAVGGLLLLAMPLAGLAYTLGGVETGHLAATVWCLLLALVQVGTVSLWVATRVHSTDQAAWQAHLRVLFHLVVLMPIYHLPLLIAGWILLAFLADGDVAWSWSIQPAGLWGYVLENRRLPWHIVFLGGIPALVASVMYVRQALRAMDDRALEQRRNPPTRMWFWRDPAGARTWPVWLRWLMVSRHEQRLPADDGLAWRELSRLPLLCRDQITIWPLLGALPILPIFLGSLVAADSWQVQAERLHVWRMIPTVVATLGLVILAAGAFGGERRRSTLEVLLVTPLTTRQILVGKLAGCRRLIAVTVAINLLLAVLSSVLGIFSPASEGVGLVLYPIILVVALTVVLSSLMWLSLLTGLILRRNIQAVVVTMLLLVGWCWLPGVVAGDLSLRVYPEWQSFLTMCSPIALVADLNVLYVKGQVIMTGMLGMGEIVVLGLHAILWILFRACCLRIADRRLGRA